ncbi:uncharacterized protein LOC131003469 [Salvia miltiorrhiza]|uniref:uncharacterized protein LOC131003469 n=1 Tax=Salvia miltiorrhiza TaxID=226208 RepID=UPI0025ACA07A|nr:uncharacterized protein LOC131003469 [Salvia miltiorrhiza]
MTSNLKPAYAYTVVYVKDVAKSVDFYAKALGYNVRRLDDSHRWGELESGSTTIAFTPAKQHETDDLTGSVKIRDRNPVEVCFDYDDVDAAFKVCIFKSNNTINLDHDIGDTITESGGEWGGGGGQAGGERVGPESGVRERYRWHRGQAGKPRT